MDLSWVLGGWSSSDEPPPVAATARSPMANLPSQLYPELDVKWYPNAAEEDPSTWKETGLKQPGRPRRESPAPTAEVPAPAPPQGDLQVTVAAALALEPSGEEVAAGWYCVSAYYPNEDLHAQESRRTQPLQSTRPKPRGKEECTLNQRIRVPFNTREQFLRVALYRCKCYEPGSSCSSCNSDNITPYAEATVPIADPAVASMSMWPLVRDFEQRGGVLLSVSMPGSGSAESLSAHEPVQPAAGPATPAPSPPQEEHEQHLEPDPQISRHGELITGKAGPPAAVQGRLPSTALEQPPPNDAVAAAVSGSADECSGLVVGSEVEVFSKTACKWQRGRVVQIEDYVLTADYEVTADGETMARRRQFHLGASNLHESLRIPGLHKAALKELQLPTPQPLRSPSPRAARTPPTEDLSISVTPHKLGVATPPKNAGSDEVRCSCQPFQMGDVTPSKNSEATQFKGFASSLAARLSPWSACMSSSPDEAQEVVLTQVPVMAEGPVLPRMWGARAPLLRQAAGM